MTLQTAPESTAVRSATPVRRWHWVALVGILILAAGLRVHGLTLSGLWIDELYSLEFSAGHGLANLKLPRETIIDHPPALTRMSGTASVGHVWVSLKDETHPPLYYTLLRIWRDAFGSSDAAVRSLSLVASIAAIVLLFDLGQVLLGPAAALWACLIFALAHAQIWYAQEARSYTLLIVTILGAAAALVRIERLGYTRCRAVALAGWLLATMLTHYLGAAGCLVLGLYAVIRLPAGARRGTFGAMAVSAAVFALVWGPFLMQQIRADHTDTVRWMYDTEPGFFPRWAGRVLLAPIRLLSHPSTNAAASGRVAAVLLALPFLMLRRRPMLLLPALGAVAWIVSTALGDLWHKSLLLEHERFYLTSAPFLYLTAAGLLTGERRPWLPHVVPASLTLYCILSLPWVYVPHRAEWRELGQSAARFVRDGDVIVYYTPNLGLEHSGTAYLAIDHYAPGVATRALFLDGAAPPHVLADLRSAPAVWLVTDVIDGDKPIDRLLPGFALGESHFAYYVGWLTRLQPAPHANTAGGAQ